MRGAAVLLVGLALIAWRDPGCGGVDTTTSGPNAPCTRDKDCNDGLTCAHGVCASPDAGIDDAGDAAADDAGHD